jgi:hypothetical protein
VPEETKQAQSIEDVKREWIFTVGSNHYHPVTGEPLGYAFVAIEGTAAEARATMFKYFDRKWAMQYPSRGEAGVERWNLHQIPLPEVH